MISIYSSGFAGQSPRVRVTFHHQEFNLNTAETAAYYTYDPFGNVTSGAPEFDSYYGYNEEETNPVTGKQYLRARYYDTENGRFESADDYLGSITQPLTLNRCSYTLNNPVMYTDPSGHLPAWTGTVTGKLIGSSIKNLASSVIVQSGKSRTGGDILSTIAGFGIVAFS